MSELNPSEELSERRMLVEQLIAICCLGNKVQKKLIQVFRPNLSGSRPRKHACSKTWSTILKGEDICTLGSRWLIGSNCTLNFWSDKWLTSGDLRGLIFGLLNLGEELLCINNIYEDGI